MTGGLRDRGIAAFGALLKNGGAKEMADVAAWEREAADTYPALEHLGPFSKDEQEFVEQHIRTIESDFQLTAGSTYHLPEGRIEQVVATAGVRLYRIQHSRLKRKTGPKPRNLDKQMSTAKRLLNNGTATSKSDAAKLAVRRT